ncbi:hypothetical protein EVA_04838 [gut metagenome]|uniref:Uncharacterized protein n=1 Tax=gut metagenome TaxID=749906 RepID=J9GIS0_9ZZZZ
MGAFYLMVNRFSDIVKKAGTFRNTHVNPYFSCQKAR